jgi:hypothetical protein
MRWEEFCQIPLPVSERATGNALAACRSLMPYRAGEIDHPALS